MSCSSFIPEFNEFAKLNNDDKNDRFSCESNLFLVGADFTHLEFTNLYKLSSGAYYDVLKSS